MTGMKSWGKGGRKNNDKPQRNRHKVLTRKIIALIFKDICGGCISIYEACLAVWSRHETPAGFPNLF